MELFLRNLHISARKSCSPSQDCTKKTFSEKMFQLRNTVDVEQETEKGCFEIKPETGQKSFIQLNYRHRKRRKGKENGKKIETIFELTLVRLIPDGVCAQFRGFWLTSLKYCKCRRCKAELSAGNGPWGFFCM